jgi:hypothetical protein
MKKQQVTLYIILLSVSISQGTYAQRLSDPVILKQDRFALGSDLMKKSKTGKAVGYGMLAAGAAGTIVSAFMLSKDEGQGSRLFWASCLTMAISNPVLCRASKNKGKAEILLMNPTPSNNEDRHALMKTYRRHATNASIIAWTMFIGGLVGTVYSLVEEDGGLLTVSAIAMFGSLPVWMNAAKNKGRLSIITNKQNLLYSFRSGNSLHRSIGLSIPISKK